MAAARAVGVHGTTGHAVVVCRFLKPLVTGSAPGVHEEIGHCVHFKTQLFSNGDLHVLRRS